MGFVWVCVCVCVCLCVCVCVCVSCPPFFEAPRFALRGGLGYVSPAPPEQPRRTSSLSTRAVVLGVTSFGPPPFLPKRSVCNSKSLLRAPRFCVRARLDTLRFRSGELGSDFVVPWSFLESFRVIPCQDSPRDRLWTESGRIFGLPGPLAPLTSALASETASSIE